MTEKVMFTDQWVSSAETGMAAVFGTFTNTGYHAAHIVSGSSPAAGRVEIHEVVPDGDGSKAMRPKDGGVTVPAGGTQQLVPGGDHLMLMDLTEPLQPGADVALTVMFEDGSTLPVTAQVRDFAGSNEEYRPSAGSPTTGLPTAMADFAALSRHAVNRRRLLTGGAAALAASATLTQCTADESVTATDGFGIEAEPFHGAHQGGVATPPQAHALFIALDLKPQSDRSPRDTLMAILKLWTSDAERLTQGQPALADTEPELAQRPARLTVTVGLDPRWCGGDLLLQICADDPSVVAHTSRVLLKNVRAMTVQRWRQNGFRTARAADTSGATMRNLMGQIDGTANPREDADFDRHIWDNGTQQRWFAGGTVLVMRRICTELDTWDELDRASKELTVGRRLDTGAPLTGQREFDEPDLVASEGGIAVIPPNAHIALARHRIRNVVVGTAARAAEPLPILGNLAFGDRRDLGLLDCGPRSGELYFFKVAVRCQQRESGADWAEEKERHKAEDGTVASLGGGSCQFRGGLQNNN